MRAKAGVDLGGISVEECGDASQMFGDGCGVAFLLVGFVPLVVIVKDQGDDDVEVINKSVRRGPVDQEVKPVVEAGEIVKPCGDVGLQGEMLVPQLLQVGP